MATEPGGATTKQFIVAAQKATNQLKALLANAKPASEAGSGSSAADALLSDITDSLSQALASLQFGALASQPPPGQSSTGGGGGRRSAPRRRGLRVRMDGACRMIVLRDQLQDSYTWRKYGQKDILGARFPRSYFRCSRNPSCRARKQVQKTNADPSKLEIIYLDMHTCNNPNPPPQPSQFVPAGTMISSSSSTQQGNTVPSAQSYFSQPSSLMQHLHPVPKGLMTTMMDGSSVLVPVAAAVPAAPSSSATCTDPVPDDDTTTFTPSIAEEGEAQLLLIPSPACSQSELLLMPTEVSKVDLHGPPFWIDHDYVACDLGDECDHISDSVVPEM